MRFALVIALAASLSTAASAQDTLYTSPDFAENGAYSVLSDRVVQHRLDGASLTARVTGPAEIRSEYAAAYRPRLPASTIFKLSLNQRDNERPPFQDHVLPLRPGVSPVYVFGEPDPEAVASVMEAAPPAMQGETIAVTIRADLRRVLRAFETDGYFVGIDGERIEAADFEGVYVAGSQAPLSWNWNGLGEGARLTDADGDGIYSGTFTFEAAPGARPLSDDGSEAIWRLQPNTDLSAYPTFTSSVPLLEALWPLSLEELQQNVRPDGALMAGAKWPGVWTRDVSYAALLSLAALDPDAVRSSLLAKLDTLRLEDGREIVRILQDTGTGGSWPVSTDRMTWALAAWEVYVVTGDLDLLRTAYRVLAESARTDLQVAYDSQARLIRGEQSFLDWREQSYPAWMTPVDIAQSKALGTNVVHSVSRGILAQMGRLLHTELDLADRLQWGDAGLRQPIRRQFWDEEAGTYRAYRYGPEPMALADRSETLGTALAVVLGVAPREDAVSAVANTPVVAYGAPSFFPQITGVPPYHNDGVWPFVNAFWTWAAADMRNEAAALHGLGAALRASALFLTNKENLVATTGHYEGTEVNSDRQLWSVAGTLAMPLRVLLGARFYPDGLELRPYVPEAYAGVHVLDGLRWRGATLRIEVRGHGSVIRRVLMDEEESGELYLCGTSAAQLEQRGIPEPRPGIVSPGVRTLNAPMIEGRSVCIPPGLTGYHTFVIELDEAEREPSRVNVVPNAYAPATPVTSDVAPDGSITWSPAADAPAYDVWIDGERIATTADTAFVVPASPARREVQVRALGTNGHRSFLSDPMPTKPYGGPPISPITLSEAEATLPIDVRTLGRYALRVQFENRAGPVNTGSLADVRIVTVNGEERGFVVFPQLGPADGGLPLQWSAPVRIDLAPGDRLSLRFDSARTNMRGEAVPVRLVALDLTPLSD